MLKLIITTVYTSLLLLFTNPIFFSGHHWGVAPFGNYKGTEKRGLRRVDIVQAMCEKFPKLPPPPSNEIGVPRAACHLARAPPLHSIRINMHSICRGKNHVREFRLADGRRGVDKQTQLLTVLPWPL